MSVHRPLDSVGRAGSLRRTDVARRIDIDFARHDHGPVSQWPCQARPGDVPSLGDPKPGGFVLEEEAPRLALIGDASALHAVETFLEHLAASMEATASIDVPSAKDVPTIVSASTVQSPHRHLLEVSCLPREHLYNKACLRQGHADFRSRDNDLPRMQPASPLAVAKPAIRGSSECIRLRKTSARRYPVARPGGHAEVRFP